MMVYKKGFETAADLARKYGQSVVSVPAEVYSLSALCVSGLFLAGLVLRSYTTLHALRPHRYSPSGADVWVASLFAGDFAGYFLDIGGCTDWRTSNSRLLEERGWQGVCADPFPRGEGPRTCGIITQAIGGHMHRPASLANCTARVRNSSANAIDMMREEDCPVVKVTTYGIREFLDLIEAPHVIDYVSLGAAATSAQILKGFPWKRFCVRHWSIHAQATWRDDVRRSLTDHGCRISEGLVETWASCQCQAYVGTVAKATASASRGPTDTHAKGEATHARLARSLPAPGEHEHSSTVSATSLHHRRPSGHLPRRHSREHHELPTAAESSTRPHGDVMRHGPRLA